MLSGRGQLTMSAHPQKHHDIVNYALVFEEEGERLLYSTDLDSLEPTDVGEGLMHLGMFDTILLEGNYDEPYLRSYIEYMISIAPEAQDPGAMDNTELELWVKRNYRMLPEDVARNAFRAIQNHRHLSKQQARAYAATHLKPGGSYYIFHADSEGENFRTSLRKAGLKIAQCCVWVKNTMVMGRQDYQWQHEPCLYGWKPGAGHQWNSDRKQTTVWNFDRPQRSSLHPTMKPIALMAYPISNSSTPGQIVVDLFSGSGSTLMACQQIDRICHAMEIDPRYVTATILRYQTMFPSQPICLVRKGRQLNVKETATILAAKYTVLQ